MSTIPRNPDGTLDESAFRDPAGVDIYSYGLCFASVCSALTLDEVKAAMAAYPTGVTSQWTLSEDDSFRDGRPHPCPCDAKPATHTHYLFAC